jgi:hypothetical protein
VLNKLLLVMVLEDYIMDFQYQYSEFSYIELSILEGMIPEKDGYLEMKKGKEELTFSQDFSLLNL